MTVNHRLLSLAFAFAVGLSVSWCSYRWVTDQDRGARRAVEEAVVLESRQILRRYVGGSGDLEISDALHRVRAAGKVYIYPSAGGWELSGHYRRPTETVWRPYLMVLDRNSALVSLSVQDSDPAMRQLATQDPRLKVTGGH